MLRIVLLLLSLQTSFYLSAQNIGIIKGMVTDKQNGQPLVGARVIVTDLSLGAVTDTEGRFAIEKVPAGRQNISCQYIGYQSNSVFGVLVSPTREVYLTIELQPETYGITETVISSTKNAFEAVNPLSVVSTRSFTAEETDRIAAGINDPGRVALSFPGVKQGPDETENTIIVRGNSPVGILWRVEGIDIPNPNHFALIGSSVGGVNVFSAQLLSRSDFSSGGMAAEYGNALSAAFDMHFRQGNTERREHRVKIGVIGLDFSTEGPIRKDKSSYLVNYRYSTLGLLNRLGFHLVGERVSNDFQDLSFNILLKSTPRFKATIFGMGGLSLEEYSPVENPLERDSAIFDNRNHQYKPAKMGATGTTLTWMLNDRSYLKGVVAVMGSSIRRENDTLNFADFIFRYNTERYNDRRISSAWVYNLRMTDRVALKSGAIFHQIFFDFYKNAYPVASQADINSFDRFGRSVQGKGSTQTIQQYTQAVWRLRPSVTANFGYHFSFLTANKTWSLEPRASLQYQYRGNQRLSLVYGLQGQMLPLMAYYFTDDQGNTPNKNLKMMQAHHGVLAWHLFTKNKMKISAETYLQKITRVPVSPESGNNYWMLNQTNGYPLFQVVSQGGGLNYGLDMAIEKLFARSWFILTTLSVFESKMKGYDGVEYHTNWSAGFSSSLTFGKEFSLRKSRVLQIGGRFLYSGGNRYTPHDPILSAQQGTYVALAGATNTAQVPNFYRLDTRIQYRYHTQRLSGSISLDIQNALNHINATGVGYEATTNTTVVQYRGGGLIPVIVFQFDF